MYYYTTKLTIDFKELKFVHIYKQNVINTEVKIVIKH